MGSINRLRSQLLDPTIDQLLNVTLVDRAQLTGTDSGADVGTQRRPVPPDGTPPLARIRCKPLLRQFVDGYPSARRVHGVAPVLRRLNFCYTSFRLPLAVEGLGNQPVTDFVPNVILRFHVRHFSDKCVLLQDASRLLRKTSRLRLGFAASDLLSLGRPLTLISMYANSSPPRVPPPSSPPSAIPNPALLHSCCSKPCARWSRPACRQCDQGPWSRRRKRATMSTKGTKVRLLIGADRRRRHGDLVFLRSMGALYLAGPKVHPVSCWNQGRRPL
jgi:hypothetical protein